MDWVGSLPGDQELDGLGDDKGDDGRDQGTVTEDGWVAARR